MKNQNKKERLSNIAISFKENSVVGISVEISTDKGIRILDENDNELPVEKIECITFYEGENKTKVLFQMPVIESKYIFDANLALLQFDIIYAIDTNKKLINGEYICVTAFSRCEKIGDKIAEGFTTSFDPWCAKSEEKHENIAWAILLDNIPKCDKKYSVGKKVGIIVDSDLGNLNNYNNRSEPIFENVYLPENFKLIYARADSSSEWLPNKLIQMCEKHAKELLSEIEKDKDEEP